MTRPHLNLAALEADLPRALRVGRLLSIAALVFALSAIAGVGALNISKADRASDDARAAQRAAELSYCALANAQRSGNPLRPPPTSDLGAYSGAAWQAAYEGGQCGRFSAAEMDAVVAAVRTGPSRTTSPTTKPGG